MSHKTEAAFYLYSKDAWEAMYQDCLHARKSIDVEQYIFQDDTIGRKFLDIFLEKARQGVTIRLLLDRVGSRSLYGSAIIQEIMNNGGRIQFYNPLRLINIFLPTTLFPRNHTKVVIIDNKIGYIGSTCFSDSMETWRDTQMRFMGNTVDMASRDFDHHWIHKGKKEKRVFKARENNSENFFYMVNKPHFQRNPIYEEVLRQIKTARGSVRLATPYFLPPGRLYRALKKAVQRGVTVEVIMSRKSDIPIADHVAHSYFPKLLRHGINIYLYEKSVFHTKYAVIDDDWATIGSTNMDYLSLLRNREANMIIRDEKIVAQIESHFQHDKAECIQATMDYWNDIPVIDRIIGYVGRIVKKVL